MSNGPPIRWIILFWPNSKRTICNPRSPDRVSAVLIRRLYFDLVGLPPTPQEVDEFLADHSTDAYAKLVDRLLASPHFGERWGRHWLDLVRYADTLGHEFDYPLQNAFGAIGITH